MHLLGFYLSDNMIHLWKGILHTPRAIVFRWTVCGFGIWGTWFLSLFSEKREIQTLKMALTHTHTHTHTSWKPETGSIYLFIWEIQFNYCYYSVTQLCLTLCDPMNCSTPGFPALHYLPEFAQTHVRWVNDVIQSFHPLLLPSPPAFSFAQHQGLFQWVCSSHQVANVLEVQLQHQSFQWIFRVDFL